MDKKPFDGLPFDHYANRIKNDAKCLESEMEIVNEFVYRSIQEYYEAGKTYNEHKMRESITLAQKYAEQTAKQMLRSEEGYKPFKYWYLVILHKYMVKGGEIRKSRIQIEDIMKKRYVAMGINPKRIMNPTALGAEVLMPIVQKLDDGEEISYNMIYEPTTKYPAGVVVKWGKYLWDVSTREDNGDYLLIRHEKDEAGEYIEKIVKPSVMNFTTVIEGYKAPKVKRSSRK